MEDLGAYYKSYSTRIVRQKPDRNRLNEEKN